MSATDLRHSTMHNKGQYNKVEVRMLEVEFIRVSHCQKYQRISSAQAYCRSKRPSRCPSESGQPRPCHRAAPGSAEREWIYEPENDPTLKIYPVSMPSLCRAIKIGLFSSPLIKILRYLLRSKDLSKGGQEAAHCSMASTPKRSAKHTVSQAYTTHMSLQNVKLTVKCAFSRAALSRWMR